MSYRGMGGYRAGDVFSFRIRRRRRAGDFINDGSAVDTIPSDSSDESAGLDTSTGTPDFSDVTGGSSSVDLGSAFGGAPILTGGLGSLSQLSGIGSAIQQFMGGGGGSVAAAGAAALGAAASSGTAKSIGKAIRKRLAHAISGGKSHRRMNPGNFHALRRSMRRLKAFEHAARRVYSFTHRTAGRSHFKFRGRKRR